MDDAERWPGLYGTASAAYAPTVRLTFSREPAPEHLVARVHVVARSAGNVVVCESDNGWRFLPGGTREPGESVPQTVDRELAEEAGACRTGPLTALGSFRAVSTAPAPWRAHLPHPVSHWWYAACDVTVVGEPTNPPDGERITAVHLLAVAEAVEFLAAHDRVHADVLALASSVGLV